jgi:hypothetical protein
MPKKSCLAALAVAMCLCILAPGTIGLTTTSDARIVDASGQEVILKGINIAGFNNNFRGPGDLNAGYDSLTQHFSHVIWRIKSLGFNAVRLPFTFKVSPLCQCMYVFQGKKSSFSPFDWQSKLTIAFDVCMCHKKNCRS